MSNDILVKALVDDAVTKAIKHYGIEGTIQIIESVYACMPKIKNVMLDNINKRLRND